MKRRLVYVCCVSSVLVGCGELPPADSGVLPGGTVETADEATTYTDPDTGVVYEVNRNRRVLSGDGALAATHSQRENPDGTTEIRSAVNATGTDTDWSGQVQTQIVECISRGPVTGSISGGCGVSADYVLVGGGAEDVYNGPGAMLWESRPQDVDNFGTGTVWLASSKDHLTPTAHTLHVWAIGLRLKKTDGTFLTHDQLKSYISYSTVTSSSAQHPTATCTPPTGKGVIAGGVRSNWPATGGAGQLLTQSECAGKRRPGDADRELCQHRPDNHRRWKAALRRLWHRRAVGGQRRKLRDGGHGPRYTQGGRNRLHRKGYVGAREWPHAVPNFTGR
jgi:hypothetical protein